MSVNKLNRFFYNHIVKTFQIKPPAIEKWESELNIENLNWNNTFENTFTSLCHTKLQNFQYKFLHRAIFTNSRLFKMKLVNSESCTFCKSNKETTDHLFWDCEVTKNYIKQYLNFIKQNCNLELHLSKKMFFLGLDTKDKSELHGLNCSLIILKYSILQAKLKNTTPKFQIFLNSLKSTYNIEVNSKKYEHKWVLLAGALSIR